MLNPTAASSESESGDLQHAGSGSAQTRRRATTRGLSHRDLGRPRQCWSFVANGCLSLSLAGGEFYGDKEDVDGEVGPIVRSSKSEVKWPHWK